MLTPWSKPVDETALKEKFAEALLREPKDAYGAAQKVVGPTNLARALEIAQLWPNDAQVLAFQVDLIEEHGAEYFLPTKAELCRKIYELGELGTASVAERLSAYRLYADIRGFTPKTGGDVNLTVNQNRVMYIKDHGSDDDWENKLKAQQAKLIEHATD